MGPSGVQSVYRGLLRFGFSGGRTRGRQTLPSLGKNVTVLRASAYGNPSARLVHALRYASRSAHGLLDRVRNGAEMGVPLVRGISREPPCAVMFL